MLTKSQISALAPRVKKYAVLVEPHLYVSVQPTGEKSWFFRKIVKGKTIKKTLGRVDKVSFYEARRLRDDMLEAIEKSGVAMNTFNERTFAEVAEEWMEKKCVPTTGRKNVDRQRSRLDRLVLPILGDEPCRSVSAAKVLNNVLRPIEARKQYDLAHATKGLIGMILRYGVACGYADRDVTADLKDALRPVVVNHFPHLTDKSEISLLLQRIYALRPSSTRFGLLLCAYTFVRPGEALGAKWAEIDFQKAEWKIPATRMKRRRDHIVPLSTQVLALLREAYQHAAGSPYVLPSTHHLKGSISPASYRSTLRNLGYVSGTMTTHGFRSIASTALNDHHWDPDAIELQLSHVEGNGVRASYNHAKKLDIRVKMMQWYADYLDSLRLSLPEPALPA